MSPPSFSWARDAAQQTRRWGGNTEGAVGPHGISDGEGKKWHGYRKPGNGNRMRPAAVSSPGGHKHFFLHCNLWRFFRAHFLIGLKKYSEIFLSTRCVHIPLFLPGEQQGAPRLKERITLHEAVQTPWGSCPRIHGLLRLQPWRTGGVRESEPRASCCSNTLGCGGLRSLSISTRHSSLLLAASYPLPRVKERWG